MIVVDASAAMSALLTDGESRQQFSREQLHAPHLIDAEVASGLRGLVLANKISAQDAERAIDVLRQIGLTRYPMTGVLPRVWQLRNNLSSYDACYIALAEELGCGLVTADARISRATGIHCVVSVVPR